MPNYVVTLVDGSRIYVDDAADEEDAEFKAGRQVGMDVSHMVREVEEDV